MFPANFKRWIYRGQRPHLLARVMNRGWAILASTGIASNYVITLEVTGRKSGRTISFPLVVAVIKGQRYLVSMLGEDAQWVRNVQANGGKAVIHAGNRQEIQLEEVPVSQRAPILKSYLGRAPGARPHIPVSMNAPVEEFEKIAASFPVFRIVPGG